MLTFLLNGLLDVVPEKWEYAETKIISHCTERLPVALEKQDIDRAHRVGAYFTGSARQVMLKFASIKTKNLAFIRNAQFSVERVFRRPSVPPVIII